MRPLRHFTAGGGAAVEVACESHPELAERAHVPR